MNLGGADVFRLQLAQCEYGYGVGLVTSWRRERRQQEKKGVGDCCLPRDGESLRLECRCVRAWGDDDVFGAQLGDSHGALISVVSRNPL